jgi:hypothetical protein
MMALAEDFDDVLASLFAVLAAVESVRAIFFHLARAGRMRAFGPGHLNLRHPCTQGRGRGCTDRPLGIVDPHRIVIRRCFMTRRMPQTPRSYAEAIHSAAPALLVQQ